MTTTPHDNNFDALRIGAALMVLFDHQFAVTGQFETFFLWRRSIGELAVEIFFAVSGYLVAQSWQLDPHPLRFVVKRMLRIWPGLLIMLLLTTLLFGTWLSSLPASNYLADGRTWRYLLSNLALRPSYQLPGVFLNNPLPEDVNGSLWTLPYEVRWYLILLVLGLVGGLRRAWLIGLIWACIYINYFFIYGADERIALHGDHHYAAELGIFFLAGTVLHAIGEPWRRHRFAVACLAGAIGLVLAWLRYPMAAAALFVPTLALAFGTTRTAVICRAGRFGDPSYGIYIYAFFVQQSVTAVTANRLGYLLAVPISLAITVLFAYLSWHLVERPSLRLKNRFGRPSFEGVKLAAANSGASDTAR